MKCDEARPHCRRCIETGRKCEGPPAERLTIRQYRRDDRARHTDNTTDLLTASPLPALSQHHDPLEARTFDFYVHRAAPALAGCLDDDLWRILVPQVSQSNPAIRQAVLAISTLYEHPLLEAYGRTGIRYNAQQRRAVAWYRASIAHALSQHSLQSEQQQLESSLLSSLLFISIEILHGMVHNTLGLLQQSYKLLDRYLTHQMGTNTRTSTPSKWIEELVCPFLVRQAVLFTVFGHVLPPEFYVIVFRTMPCDMWPIDSLAQGRTVLYALLLRTFDLVQNKTSSDLTDPSIRQQIMQRQSGLLQDLSRWRSEVDELINRSALSSAQRALYHNLVCNQKVSQIWLRSLHTSLTEAAADTNAFSDIITHSELSISCLNTAMGSAKSVPFMIELGVMPPLFFVGWQGPSHHLRCQAVALLRQAPAQESLFVGQLQINALEKIIAIEKGLIGKIRECDAAEEARLPHFFKVNSTRQVVSKCLVHDIQSSSVAKPALVDRSLALPRPDIFRENDQVDHKE